MPSSPLMVIVGVVGSGGSGGSRSCSETFGVSTAAWACREASNGGSGGISSDSELRSHSSMFWSSVCVFGDEILSLCCGLFDRLSRASRSFGQALVLAGWFPPQFLHLAGR